MHTTGESQATDSGCLHLGGLNPPTPVLSAQFCCGKHLPPTSRQHNIHTHTELLHPPSPVHTLPPASITIRLCTQHAPQPLLPHWKGTLPCMYCSCSYPSTARSSKTITATCIPRPCVSHLHEASATCASPLALAPVPLRQNTPSARSVLCQQCTQRDTHRSKVLLGSLHAT